MRNIIQSIFFLGSIVCCYGCNLKCTDGTGSVQTDKRDLKVFTQIDLELSADVIVKKSDVSYAVVEAQENLLSKIQTDVHGSALKISSDGCISTSEKIKVTVYTKEIEGLEVEGSGNMSVPDTFVVSNLKIEMGGSGSLIGKFIAEKVESEIKGSGNVSLAGSANKQEAEVSGSGLLNAKSLPCNEATISVNGSGNASIYAIKSLEATVNGSGVIRYRGKPSVNSHVNGSGKVVDEN
jgi:hypothetical protein